MPARKRNRRPPEHPDPVVRFGRALEVAKANEIAAQHRAEAERAEQERLAKIAADHAAELERANRRLERAIADVKRARSSGQGTTSADAEYRAAKAQVVELETGNRPTWAPVLDAPTEAPTEGPPEASTAAPDDETPSEVEG
jgi:hypothetical protein